MRLAVLLVALAGCGYRVALVSHPTTVNVLLPNGDRVSTPAEVRLKYVPFGRQRVVASAEGFRTVQYDLCKTEIRGSRYVFGTFARPGVLSGGPRGEVQLVLVPEHGPVGSWTESEVK